MDADDFMSSRSSPHLLRGKCKLQQLLLCPEHPDTPAKETMVGLTRYLFLAGLHLGTISRHVCVTPLDSLIKHSLWNKKCSHGQKKITSCKFYDSRIFEPSDYLATSALKRSGRRAELAPQLLRFAKPDRKICI